MNQNNESLCLFLSVSSEDDLKKWLKWSHDFTTQNPRIAIAYYFKGDALARLQEWDSALIAINKALELYPNHPMVLNARGVMYASKKEWDLALIDFHMATKASSSFADAYSNYGTMYIQKKEGAEGALEWSNRALEISPDFILALNTRGCAKLILHEWDEAQQDFQYAEGKISCGNVILAENLVKIVDYMNGRKGKEGAKLSKEEAGTTLETRFEALKNNPNQWNANRFVNYMRENPADLSRGMSMIKNNTAQNPEWGNKLQRSISKGVNWNTEISQGITNIVRGFTADLGIKYKGITTGVNYDFKNWANSQDKVTHGNLEIWRNMENTLRPTIHTFENPGGVKTDISDVPLDKGDWPFVTHYGLFYQIGN